MDEIWDCIVIGGGAAGLSAALVLGRARRRTLVVDAGGQSNLPAHGVGGLLGHDGRPPSEWPLERDPYLLESSVPGVFVAGDVRAASMKRVASAVGEGAMAVSLVHTYLERT